VSSFRRDIRRLASAWLVAQLTTLVAVPIALSQPASAAATVQECCPGAGPGHECPMRHRHEAARACGLAHVCRADAALLSTVGLNGVLPSLSAALAHPVLPRPVDLERAPLTSRATLPEPPPPRA
jgi:hypothetical protein